MTEERAKVPPEQDGEPELLVLPDEPEGDVAEGGGTATVVLGAAAGTLAGAFLGPVGAIVGAVAGGALAGAVADTDKGETEGTAMADHEEQGGTMMQGLGKMMGNFMHEMGLDQDGGWDKGIDRLTDGKNLQQHVKDGMKEIAGSETASIAVGGTAGAVVGSILGPVGSVVGAVAGGLMGDRLAEQMGGSQPQGVKAVVEASAKACAAAKEQLIAQMDQVQTPEGRTVLQMAINAVNQSVVELETASGSL